MLIAAFYRGDLPWGYCIQLHGVATSAWAVWKSEKSEKIDSDPSPEGFTLNEIQRLASLKPNLTPDQDLSFALYVSIASDNGWIPNDEYNGILRGSESLEDLF